MFSGETRAFSENVKYMKVSTFKAVTTDVHQRAVHPHKSKLYSDFFLHFFLNKCMTFTFIFLADFSNTII